MDETQPVPQDERPSPEMSAFEQFLADWIATVPPVLAEAARYAALPHSFDLALLSSLWGTAEDASTLVALLERAGLIAAIGPGWYTFQPTLRQLYLRRWQTGDPHTYRQASAQAADFYLACPTFGEAERLEAVYHQLGADDALGLEALSQAFEDAWTASRPGLAERLLQYANEQEPVLGTGARDWLRYFEARLDLAQYRYPRSEQALLPLVAPEVDPRLRAQALMSLAHVLAATQRWTEALRCYASAHDLFLDLDDPFSAARALQAQGIAYLHLASSLGGVEESAAVVEPRLLIWFRRFQYAPFLLYRWFSRRIPLLPNLYFGADYQDWIIFRLLYRAIRLLEQASCQLATVPEGAGLPVAEVRADIQIHLADLYHRTGRWTKAQNLFAALTSAPPVRADDYRRATLQLAQGRAALAQSLLNAAREHLAGARQVFARYNDQRALATTARLLAETEVAAGNLSEAILLYAASADTSLAVDDLLASTHVWTALQEMRQRFTLTAAVQSQLDALEQKLERRAYIMRFRGDLLQRFRTLATRLAAYVILPLTYLLMSALHLARLHWAVIGLVAQIMPRQTPLLSDLVSSIVLFLAGLLPAVWIYAFFYVLIGWIFVRRLDLDDIAQLQTEFVVTVPEGITTRDEKGQLSELPWAEVQSYVSANRSIWRVPVALFSRLFVTSEATPVVVDGVARHYTSLQHDITGRLARAQDTAARHTLDFSFFGSRWTPVILLLVIAMTIVSLFDWLDPTCREPNIVSLGRRDQSYAYLSTEEGQLFVVGTWDLPEKLTIEGSLPLSGPASDIALAGSYAYVSAGEAGLEVVDVSDPTMPAKVGSFDTPGQASGVAVAGHYAYIADGPEGLRVVDIADPAAPVAVGFCETPGPASDVAVTRHLALVTAGTQGLLVVSVQDPAAPRVVGSCDTPGQASAVAVRRQLAYVADGTEGLRIVSFTDPSAPVAVGNLDTPGQAHDVVITRRYAYIAAGTEGLRVVHLPRPTAPKEVATYDTPGQATGVAVIFDYAYVADAAWGLRAVDILNPCQLAVDEVGYLRTLGSATAVAAPRAISLPIASISFELTFWALLFFPIIGLARLLHNRAALRRVLGSPLAGGADWPLWIALVLLVALTVLHTLSLTL